MPKLIAERNVDPWKRRLYLPTYSVTESAIYAGTTLQSIGYWNFGGGVAEPTLEGRERGRSLSYLELVEVAFVATFRRLGVSLQKIRKARDYAAKVLSSQYPFAELRWKTEGTRMILDLWQTENEGELKQVIIGDAFGREAWQGMMGDRFFEFDYEDDLALVWHLRGRKSPIVIDPRIAFGAPMIHGIATWVLRGRWQAGEGTEDIQEDFGLELTDIEQGLQFEGISIAT